ncbi:MAG TPA: glycosyltransferase [Aliidongia sp.]|uniref:glycosyltransferase n=1 Tax=Aliidongia sp. TaxID=1914230 RepID=UPI002DDDB16E|nr:glycosyltransferase [Aliidongia sp.]HEV2678223.1 glycosyltransferase [Aliidongia sp.]
MIIAVLLPCYQEEATIAETVAAFAKSCPDATIYVYDNNSTDRTVERALAAGAVVRHESRQGKGNVVRRMFADIEADVYVMSDGDTTYDASRVGDLIDLVVRQKFDMVVGARVPQDEATHRAGHTFGNALFNRIADWLFGSEFKDIFSGYRAFSRRFVKSFPVITDGFEIETELTVHAIDLRVPVAEIPIPFGKRPDGSSSKLRTVRDGLRILWVLVLLAKEVRPFAFFAFWATLGAAASIVLAYPVVATFLETGLVPRLPTAVLAMGVALLAFLSLACGIVLDSVSRGRHETKRLRYLEIPAPPGNSQFVPKKGT